jgi:hypothetical protein
MKLFAITATLLAAASVAHAAPITTLWNTGVDAMGMPLANGSLDTHYSLVAGPVLGAPRAANSTNGFPIPPWIGDNSISAWIGPVGDSQLNGPVATYDYQTTFSLTGFSAASAMITGQWASDNEGVDILINGISTGQMTTSQFTAFTAFTITSGFVAGLNTIDFIVHNDGGPTGLRVEQTGTANAVPEPAALALFGVGAAMLGFARRRRG